MVAVETNQHIRAVVSSRSLKIVIWRNFIKLYSRRCRQSRLRLRSAAALPPEHSSEHTGEASR